jgi:transposase
MTTAATPNSTVSLPQLALSMAFELGVSEWKMAFSTGPGQSPRYRSVAARDLEGLRREIERSKVRFGLPADAPVFSCYEAGRDGFWLHRALEAMGVENLVVDSASIEVSRRSRRAKTDRLDAGKLVGMLLRYRSGERKVWSVVRVPTAVEEDRRQLHRELKSAQKDRTRITNRIKGLLFGQGIRLSSLKDLPQQLPRMKLWNGVKS